MKLDLSGLSGPIPYPVGVVLIVFGAIVFVVAIAGGISSRNDYKYSSIRKYRYRKKKG